MRNAWLAEQGAVSATLVEIGGKKFEIKDIAPELDPEDFKVPGAMLTTDIPENDMTPLVESMYNPTPSDAICCGRSTGHEAARVHVSACALVASVNAASTAIVVVPLIGGLPFGQENSWLLDHVRGWGEDHPIDVGEG